VGEIVGKLLNYQGSILTWVLLGFLLVLYTYVYNTYCTQMCTIGQNHHLPTPCAPFDSDIDLVNINMLYATNLLFGTYTKYFDS